MFKLMKYEFMKMRVTLLVMLLALVGLEIGFIAGNQLGRDDMVGVSIALLVMLVFAVYLYILIAGLVSYSRELNDKTGYMTFMTPVSPAGVVASKLLFVMLAALVAAALFGWAAYYDLAFLIRRANIDPELYRQADSMFKFAARGGSLTGFLMNAGAMAAAVVIQILAVECTAYLAITLSATILQNRRGFVRGLLSFALFAALQYALTWAGDMAVGEASAESAAELMAYLGKSAALNGAFSVVCAGAAAWLMDRRVSL